MNGLREKIRNKKGFTLVEMLIVVAIIAILIAVSIPMVGSALERSRHAVDQANIRDAMALGSLKYLSDDEITYNNGSATFTYAVNDAHQGKLITGTETGYTAVKPACTCDDHATGDLTVTINEDDGTVTTSWKFDSENDKTVDW